MHAAVAIAEVSSSHRSVTERPVSFAGWSGFVVAVLVGIASLGGIFDLHTYLHETANWRTQAIAQDWIDLAVAVPWLLASAALVFRGSRRARLALAAGFAFVAYTFAIYAFTVHFNGLFLVYVAALGIASWGLGAIVLSPLPEVAERAPRRVVATLLIGTGCAFAVLWLAGDVSAIVRGDVPADIGAAGLPTNPIHVLDLALVLPAFVAIGIAVVRRRPRALALAWIALGFLLLVAATLVAIAVRSSSA